MGFSFSIFLLHHYVQSLRVFNFATSANPTGHGVLAPLPTWLHDSTVTFAAFSCRYRKPYPKWLQQWGKCPFPHVRKSQVGQPRVAWVRGSCSLQPLCHPQSVSSVLGVLLSGLWNGNGSPGHHSQTWQHPTGDQTLAAWYFPCQTWVARVRWPALSHRWAPGSSPFHSVEFKIRSSSVILVTFPLPETHLWVTPLN